MSRTSALRMGALAALASLLLAGDALARAGGGGGYSGGGGGGGFSSGGGGGAGGEIDARILLVILAVVIAMLLVQARAERRRRAERALRSRELAERLRDGAAPFDEKAFLRRVGGAFLRIQRAWSRQDLGPVRALLSDGVHERFSIQLREQRDLGYRNVVEGVRVLETAIVDARSEEHFDTVAVRIRARAVDYRVDLASGEEIADSRRSESFVEVWSFLRARDAAPPESGGYLEGCCPNCSAPLAPERAWSCAACGSGLSGAPRDWVLAEITQESEWRARGDAQPHGVKAFCAADPGFTAQQIEDRASVLFWRKTDADRTGDAATLASVARPAFVQEQSHRLAGTASRRYVGDCAVGSVELLGLVASGEGWDRALLEVRWAGSVFERRRDTRPRRTECRSQIRSLLVLARRPGARSELAGVIASAHCPRCGGPDDAAPDARCPWCGHPLAEGDTWLLERFVRFSDQEAQALLADGSDPEPGVTPARAPRGAALFGWALRVACADRRVEAREAAALARIAQRLGLRPSLAQDLLRAAQRDALDVELPATPEEARSWISELAGLARSDGRVGDSERRVIRELEARAQRLPGAA